MHLAAVASRQSGINTVANLLLLSRYDLATSVSLSTWITL